MAQPLVRHFAPHIFKRNFRTTVIAKGSDYPTRSPYDLPENKTLETIDDIVKESNLGGEPEQDELRQHHFDTYDMVRDLKRQGFTQEQAVTIMKGMKFKLRESISILNQQLLPKAELENESYLFSAAVSELRTEIQVMRQKDTQTLKSETLLVTREVEALAQRIREDVDLMKNNIALDMDNRKNETRSEQKEIEMTIQELNSKLTVQIGEVRTALETTRWETIWKGLAGVAGTSVIIATIAYFLTNFAEKRAEEYRVQKQKRKKQMQEDALSAGLVDMDAVY